MSIAEDSIAISEPSTPVLVSVRILPMGDNKIYTGAQDPVTQAPLKWQRGDVATLPQAIAEALEERGFAEIVHK